MTQQLEVLRYQIDLIDKKLLEYLLYRQNLVKKIWKIKKKQALNILQKDRWKKVLESRINYWIKLWLSKEFIEAIWNLIHIESINQQKLIKKN